MLESQDKIFSKEFLVYLMGAIRLKKIEGFADVSRVYMPSILTWSFLLGGFMFFLFGLVAFMLPFLVIRKSMEDSVRKNWLSMVFVLVIGFFGVVGA